jgi:hypothetical protein
VRTRSLWGALFVLIVVTVTAFAVVSARRLGTQQPPSGPLAADLADRVTALMENDFRSVTTPGDASVTCAARPFGVRPEGLTRAAEATTIYAWVYCRGAGRTLLSPVALRLGKQPAVRLPETGDDRERSIRRIFPADVRDALRTTDADALKF